MRNVVNPMLELTPCITQVTTMLLHLLRRLSVAMVVCLAFNAASANDDAEDGVWNWKVIGPFENYSGSAFVKKHDAERPFDTASHKNARGGTLQWRNDRSTNTSPLAFFNANVDRHGAYLANTYVESRDQQVITLYAVVAGTLEVYVNDSLAFNSRRDILTPSSVPITRVTLEKGWNRIMIKAGNDELPFCYVTIMMMDAYGKIIQDFSSTSEPRLYPQRTRNPEPLTIPDSLYDMGFSWDDAFTDSLMRHMDATGITVHGQLQKAIQYKEQGLFTAALEQLRAAVAYCPERYDAWFLKAYIHHEMQQKDSAISCLEHGLALDPGAYGSIAFLRKLKQQPDVFSYFVPVDTDSIIRAGFSAQPMNERQMDIILHDERTVVLSGGSSVVEVDQIFRMNDEVSLSLFSRYTSDNIKNSLSLSLVDYKYYGDSVVARSDGEALVIDNIEVGDLVRIRRRYIERDTVHIPLYYRHRHEFQRRLYTHRSRYQIITPNSDRFQWRTYNTEAEPQYAETALGHRLAWDERNIKELPNEVDMPRQDLTGLIEIGTVPSWEYVAQRYTDAFVRNIGVTENVRQLMDEFAPTEDSLGKEQIIQRVREFFGNLDLIAEGVTYPYCRSIERIMEQGPRSAADYATMFISMLAARDIKAYPMIIDTNTTPFHAPPTPSASFNHVIVVVPGDSLPSFFDPTARPFASYSSLPDNVRGAFALAIRKGLREPMYVAYDSTMTRFLDEYISIQPNPDGTASILQTQHTTEQDSSATRQYVNNAQSHSNGMLPDSMWCELVPKSRLLKFCRRTGHTTPYITDPNDSTKLLVQLPWRSGAMYPDVPYDTIMRSTPLLRRTAVDSLTSTVVVHAPAGYTFAKNQPRGIFNVESTRYTLLSIPKGDSLVVTRKIVLTQPYVSPEGYVGFQVSHAKMLELDRQPVVLVPAPTPTSGRKKKK